jgi:streptomycin 6-kinase
MFTVSDVVRNKAATVGAVDWVDQLPNLVAELADEWHFDPLQPLDGSTESFLLEVRRRDDSPAVLKLIIPRTIDAARREITVLELIDGTGGPALFDHDADRGAILMERLGPSLHDLGLPIEQRHQVMCVAAGQLWRPAPDSGLPTGAQKGRWLIEHIEQLWEELDRPVQESAVEHAIACAQRRIQAHDDETAVLVHGDVHQWNTLRSRNGFALIDPDGLLAAPEYDLGIIMREDPAELLVEGSWNRAHRLADLTGLDPVAMWEWGVVERVSTGLLCQRVGLEPFGRQMLQVAEHLATDDTAG